MRLPIAILTVLTVSACAGTSSERESVGIGPDDRYAGARLARAIADASNHPLGSTENPVRVYLPAGQRAYLTRLRCSDGQPPSFERLGNLGDGVFGSVIDNYEVKCDGGEPKQSFIIMDMYHPDHTETGAPPGFTIVGVP